MWKVQSNTGLRNYWTSVRYKAHCHSFPLFLGSISPWWPLATLILLCPHPYSLFPGSSNKIPRIKFHSLRAHFRMYHCRQWKTYMIWQGLCYLPISWVTVATGVSTKKNQGANPSLQYCLSAPTSYWSYIDLQMNDRSAFPFSAFFIPSYVGS